MKSKSAQKNLKIHYSLESLGVLTAKAGEVRAEYLESRLSPKVQFPHRHDFYQIILITSGQGWHEIDFTKYNIKPGSLFLMKPGQVHEWNLSKKTRGYIIEFTRESLVASSILEVSLSTQINSSADFLQILGSSKNLNQICEIMCTEFSKNNKKSQAVLHSLLHAFLGLCLFQDVGVNNLKTASIIEKFKNLLESHFRLEHRVGFYAVEMGMSAKALTMQLSRALKKSPRELIFARCLLEAKRLLTYTDLNISEIGYELGFQDANYFARFFKSQTNMSPSDFRRKN